MSGLWMRTYGWPVALALVVVAIALPSGASARDKAAGCTNRMPPEGSLARGTRVRIPNHCHCGGRTLTIIAGGNIGRSSKATQAGPQRRLVCG